MNDKKDLMLPADAMIEWCARYGSLGNDDEEVNWELYLWERIIAFNYCIENGYINKYSTVWSFPKGYKIEVKYNQQSRQYLFNNYN